MLKDRIVNNSLQKNIWREAITVGRFGVVGIIATAIHVLVVLILLSKTSFPTLAANAIAYMMAFSISFAGNYIWTFQSPGDPGRAIRRFLVISLGAFATNSLTLMALLRVNLASPSVSALFSAAVVPAITFIASRFWGFKY